jgi:hypothetical protein
MTTSTSPSQNIGGYGPIGYWLVVHDHRFGADYQIASHCDYWDFVNRRAKS